ncbi:expressed unknown protein [Seminavis robusta]|uniref:Uncharacterized protein n=1 Tax=Seminavis robusta TaxID=568900 RepID=A0A9N8DN97_9STRA|nr:expressed unknown protein [Seminavis robusta]|eukprot:Sro231_g093630.1 n/a (188) ;mRNA; f:53736-54299
MLNDKSKNDSAGGDYILLTTAEPETPADEASSNQPRGAGENPNSVPVVSVAVPADKQDNADANNDVLTHEVSEFSMASRGQVNGAAAIFGFTGLILGGPILGLVAASGSAHLAANKSGDIANFTRRCGSYLEDYNRANTPIVKEGSAKVTTLPEEMVVKKPKGFWDKVTDRLIKMAEWTEGKMGCRD